MATPDRPVRVRFAPSPTGSLHVGGARTALFNWAFARRHGGRFLLRVEDTDLERSKPEHEVAILEGLRWMGLEWDEGPDVGGDFGPYRQSERSESYLGMASSLFQAGWAYRCFCSPERLSELREGQRAAGETPRYDRRCLDLDPAEATRRIEAGERPVLRFRVPEGETVFRDAIRGEVRVASADVDDWIMVRGDGSPTYNFVVVCDDVAMEISHVLRGDDHLTNTTKQVLLYRALGLEPPAFAHFPLMLGHDKKKLSKRTGDTALQAYRDKGYPPEAVLNFLALQGWALDDKTDVFSAEQLVAHFDVASVSKAGAVFDPEKFRWMAGEYIRAGSVARLTDRALPFLVQAGCLDAEEGQAGGPRRAWVEAAVALVQERVQLYSEVPEKLAWLFADDGAVEYDDKAAKNAAKHGPPAEILGAYRAWLAPQLEDGVDASALREGTKAWVGERGVKFPALFQPLRCALTGEAGGPDLFDTMAVLGAESTLARLDAGIERL